MGSELQGNYFGREGTKEGENRTSKKPREGGRKAGGATFLSEKRETTGLVLRPLRINLNPHGET